MSCRTPIARFPARWCWSLAPMGASAAHWWRPSATLARPGHRRDAASGAGRRADRSRPCNSSSSTSPIRVGRGGRGSGRGEVDILVNSAGVTAISGLLDADTIDGARREIEVNYLGTLNVIRALAPHMKARKRGVIVNILTVLAHASLPSMGSYCASKAAALSMTQGVRAELLPWGVRVCAIFPSTVDTSASTDSPPPKLRPAQVADAIVMMIREGLEDHYPGRIASDLVGGWRDSPKVVERELGLGLPEPR